MLRAGPRLADNRVVDVTVIETRTALVVSLANCRVSRLKRC